MVSLNDIDSLDRHGFLFGYPIAHSMSPLFHQTIYDNIGLRWSQILLESTDMNLFLNLIKDPKFYGAAVTMPHKVAIIPHLDDLTPECRDVGACNTIFLRPDPSAPTGRRYIGANTDVIGIRDSFLHNLSPASLELLTGRPGMVIGAGGAARSAVYALTRWMRCEKVYLVNRDEEEVRAVVEACTARGYGGDRLIHVKSVEQAQALEDVGAIVSCIPDFAPQTEVEKAVWAVTEAFMSRDLKGAILEMCYHPRPWTLMAEMSSVKGWQVILGTEAMIYQGLEQDRYWTGREISELPIEAVKAAISAKLEESTSSVRAAL